MWQLEVSIFHMSAMLFIISAHSMQRHMFIDVEEQQELVDQEMLSKFCRQMITNLSGISAKLSKSKKII
jgi:hypothetical protein